MSLGGAIYPVPIQVLWIGLYKDKFDNTTAYPVVAWNKSTEASVLDLVMAEIDDFEEDEGEEITLEGPFSLPYPDRHFDYVLELK